MVMPEVAGDNKILVVGKDGTPDHNPITADPLIFEMKIKDLVPIAPVGVIDPSFINFVVNSHSDPKSPNSVGSYGTTKFALDVRETVGRFQSKVLAQTKLKANPIKSEGASLYWGGLFDIHKDWQTPHCGHRDGQAMDISWKALTKKERNILADTIKNPKR